MKINNGIERNPRWAFGFSVRDSCRMVTVEATFWTWTAWIEFQPSR